MLMEKEFYNDPRGWLIKNLENYKKHYEELLKKHGEVEVFRERLTDLQMMIDRLQGKSIEESEKYDTLIEQVMTSLIAERERQVEREQQSEEVSEIASSWWAEKLEFSSHDGGFEPDLELLTLLMVEDMPKVEEDKKSSFKIILKDAIKKELMEQRNIDLYVDYGPKGILHDAAIEATLLPENHDEFDMTHIFPWKTSMSVSLDKITVKEGHKSPRVTLFDRESKKSR